MQPMSFRSVYNPAPAAAIGGTATNGDINISGGTAAKPYYDSTASLTQWLV